MVARRLALCPGSLHDNLTPRSVATFREGAASTRCSYLGGVAGGGCLFNRVTCSAGDTQRALRGGPALPEGVRMSRRLTLGVGIAIVVLIGSQGARALIAWADQASSSSASDGGSSVSVGAASSASSPARAGSGAGGSGSAGGTGATAPCTYMPLPAQYAVPLGPGGPGAGTWLLVKCPGRTLTIYNGALIWVPAGSAAAPASPGISPRALAIEAADSLVVPSPKVEVNPSRFSVVNLPTWLWIDRSTWHPLTATASAGNVTATAVAVPTTVTWSMGDGHSVVCRDPGSPFLPSVPAGAQSTDCSYAYRTSSYGQPSADGDPNDAAFSVSATVTWSVTWSSAGAPGGGSLPSLRTRSSIPIRVEQIESVGSAG
jgi:hypothetical protein